MDPDSGLAEDGHIFVRNGVIFNVMLNVTGTTSSFSSSSFPFSLALFPSFFPDVIKGKNSFYAIQIIESDKNKDDFTVFRKWGRVGTNIGGYKVCYNAKGYEEKSEEEKDEEVKEMPIDYRLKSASLENRL